jgi:excisionase family DNA binding protein
MKTLTIHDAANQLKMAKSTMYKYAETGKIPSHKIGNRIRIRESDLNAYFNSRKKKTSQTEGKK